jgi:hypothetical protein
MPTMRKSISILYRAELGDIDVYTPPHETLTATSSWPNPNTLAVCEVLPHPRATLHPCTCRLRGGAAAVAAAPIGYDDLGLLS